MKILAVFLAFFLAGCVSKFDIANPQSNAQSEFGVSFNGATNHLIAQSKDGAYEFALFDGLGVPLAHKRLKDGKFENLKFLPPKSGVDELFVGVAMIMQSGANSGTIRAKDKIYEVSRVDQ